MILKCKMCGGDLIPIEGKSTVQCEFCGTMQTIAIADNEKKTNLFNRANRLRMDSDFDKAAGIYESIVAEFPEEAEAYWGLCLCAYGIEYVDDPASGRKIPTCHRTCPESIMDNGNFERVCECADSVALALYHNEAKAIDRLQKDILTIVANEPPYDVFICYKETDASGKRTPDSVLSQDIYDTLTGRGMKVFFARITLEDKLGRQYEPYIYAALHSARVMLVIGTSFEYFNAVWVKNEWSRFLDMASRDKTKVLIPCYKDIDAYDIPKEFRNLQAQDMGKLGAMQDLVRGIEKIIGVKKPQAANNGGLPAQNRAAPSIIRNICSIPSREYDNYWPAGFYSDVINLDQYNVLYFHLLLHRQALAHKTRVSTRMVIYNEKNQMITDDVLYFNWKPENDRISRGWYIRGKDQTVVPTGRYRAVFSVENSAEMEYTFTITSNAILEKEHMQQMEYRMTHNLCRFCGGHFQKKLFKEKCISCGKPKDY